MRLLLRTAFQNKKHYFLCAAALFFMLGVTAASLLEMFAVGILTNSGSTKDPNLLNTFIQKIHAFFDVSSHVGVMIVVLLSISVFKAITLYGSKYSTQLLSIRVSSDLRQRYFEYIQTLPMSFYQKYNIGSLSSRVVGDAANVAASINSTLINFFQTPFMIVSSFLSCVYISWELSLLIFFGLPFVVFPIIYLAKRVRKVSRHIQKNQENFTSVLIDFLAGVQTVKIFAMELFSIKKYKEQNDRMAMLEQKNARYNSISRPVLHTIGGLFLASVLFYGVYFLGMSVSSLLVFSGLLYQFYEPIKKFAEENAQIQRGVVAAERMFEVLNLKPEIEDLPGAIDFDGELESIEFDNVWFRYDGEWVLKGVSFKVNKGESFAIVGPTGSGKSTIVNLIPRLFDVQKGVIRINGRPIWAYSQKSLRENISFVSQKPFLFLDTIKENIAFGRPFTENQIREAARQAYADEFIDTLPESYNTPLAESGKNLSGGQQQRLAIARALVKRAQILIMDEATSHLDAISENRIKMAIHDLKGKVTQILVAHRLSTIEDADKILYLDKGEKIAQGNKDELLQLCPDFKTMWDMMMITSNHE